MAKLKEPLDGAVVQDIDAALQRLRNSRNLGLDLVPALDIAIGITGADMGTLQRFDEDSDCLKLVASRGFSSEAPTGTSTAAAGMTSIAGGTGLSTLRLHAPDGTLYVKRGTAWQPTATGVLLLATQQGAPQ